MRVDVIDNVIHKMLHCSTTYYTKFLTRKRNWIIANLSMQINGSDKGLK